MDEGSDVEHGMGGGAPVWLAFWARNMDVIRAKGWTWPGFEYSDAEWQRLRMLADAVEAGALTAYQFVNAAIFIAIIGLLIAAIVTLLNLLHVDNASVPPWVFAAALPGMVFVMLGLILPATMRVAGHLMGKTVRARLAHVPGSLADAELATKVSRQFRRVALFAAVVVLSLVLSDAFVPPPLGDWMPWIIAACAGLFAMLFL